MLRVLGAASLVLMNAEAPPVDVGATKPAVFGRVETTVYGASGEIGVLTNETDSAFETRGLGLGALATLSLDPFRDSQPVGGVLLLGITSEYRALRVLRCGYVCLEHPDGFEAGSMLGARLGAGYEGRLVGVRGGLLVQGGSVALAETFFFPDAALRLGQREFVTFSLGLGAYDVPTTVRPGLYVGVSVSPIRPLALRAHYGLHCDIGSCGITVLQIDPRLDLSAEYALSSSVRASFGGAVALTYDHHDVYEGRAGVGVDF